MKKPGVSDDKEERFHPAMGRSFRVAEEMPGRPDADYPPWRDDPRKWNWLRMRKLTSLR